MGTENKIEGLIIAPLEIHDDERGWLAEIWRADNLKGQVCPAMAYCSMTRPGQSRGPHEHRYQTDRFGVVGPSTLRFYFWDNRSDSPTHGTHLTYDAGESNPSIIVIPPGIVHGYLNIGKLEGLVFNSPDRLYQGEGKREEIDEIRHEDDPNSPFKIDL